MMIRKVAFEVPHRISGFFEIIDKQNGKPINIPERIGSRGAGFNLSAKGKTTIILQESSYNQIFNKEIFINGEKLNEKAETTNYILDFIGKKFYIPYNIKVFHEFDLPVGCGYGASGSGALGTIYGLNTILNLDLLPEEMGRIAHVAEVVNRTGLGTVCGQLAGGLCILLEPGYPCKFERIPSPDGVRIICGTWGMIHTKSILTDPKLSLEIKKAGQRSLLKLKKNKDFQTFIDASMDFVKETKMISLLHLEEVKEILEDLNELEILGASMNQLGRSVYAICEKKVASEVIEVFDTFKPKIQIFNLHIDQNIPSIIELE